MKIPRRKHHRHALVVPKAPGLMAPTAMPCFGYHRPGLMQKWVLGCGKYMWVMGDVVCLRWIVDFQYSLSSHLPLPCHYPVKFKTPFYSVPHTAGLPKEALRAPCVCSHWSWGFVPVLFGEEHREQLLIRLDWAPWSHAGTISSSQFTLTCRDHIGTLAETPQKEP